MPKAVDSMKTLRAGKSAYKAALLTLPQLQKKKLHGRL